MADIDALMDALPVSGLEPHSIALIKGFVLRERGPSRMDYLTLLEPPANVRRHTSSLSGRYERYCRLWAIQSWPLETAQGHERVGVADERWVNLLTVEPGSPECLPILDFVVWLRNHGLLDDTLVGEPDAETKRSKTRGVDRASFTHISTLLSRRRVPYLPSRYSKDVVSPEISCLSRLCTRYPGPRIWSNFYPVRRG